jgi:hypothetical protein
MGRGCAADVLDDAAVWSLDHGHADSVQAVSGSSGEGDDAADERLRDGSRDHGEADPRRVADRGGADPVLSAVAGRGKEDQASRRVYRGVDIVAVPVCKVGGPQMRRNGSYKTASKKSQLQNDLDDQEKELDHTFKKGRLHTATQAITRKRCPLFGDTANVIC